MATELDREWVRSLPKTELHVHLIGATSPQTVVELARRHPQTRVPTGLDELQRFYTFRDFDSFVEVYQAVSGLVTAGDDVTVLIDGLARDFAEQGVRYAEVTVTAATQLADGIEPDELRRR
jgi:Adenosine deaminase